MATVTGDPSYTDAARRVQLEIAALPDAEDALVLLLDGTGVSA